jgi:hypothetical protein
MRTARRTPDPYSYQFSPISDPKPSAAFQGISRSSTHPEDYQTYRPARNLKEPIAATNVHAPVLELHSESGVYRLAWGKLHGRVG